ncbi:MAG: transaldolase [Gammaproteobacteria bacterium]|nr:transaldolase [Gammaproteobacteria bacterium]MDH3767961.1 transaldolase [Gammaproteobacteria bacterium]
MSSNPLLALKALGQSIWLDYIERDLLDGGGLASLIKNDGVSGVTSNPSIFHKAITQTGQYDETISMLANQGADADQIYLNLVVDDIRTAADVLRPVYDATDGSDGYVSLEVSPHLAHDAVASIEQGRWLWRQVGRSNLMIKIPGTRAGLAAIERLIFEGINVNVTLLFSVDRYKDVIDAYLSGLESRNRAQLPLDRVASVASFFLSRIDSAVDKKLSELDPDLCGRTAIASAKSAYQVFSEVGASERWTKLSKTGAQPQRLLWASTSTKNPQYSDVMYVENLIGQQTVNTLPPKTLDAYRDHGQPQPRIGSEVELYNQSLTKLAKLGIDLHAIAKSLEDEGLEKFSNSFDALMQSLESERVRLRSA